MDRIIGIKPFHFVHVVDLNSNIARLETGPQQLILQCNDRCDAGPQPFVVVPPGHYCVLENPCKRYVPGQPVELKYGQCDIKYHQEPFPLYPGEVLPLAKGTDYKPAIQQLPVIKANHALKLEARIDHKVGDIFLRAGQQWQVEGPLTYYPTPDDEILGTAKPHIVKGGHALRFRALEDFTDKTGKTRVTGEEWLVLKPGAYLPGVLEKFVGEEKALTLTADKALHVRAVHQVDDCLGKARQSGDEWLVTVDDTESFLPPIGVTVMTWVKKIILPKGKYCVVLDPLGKDGKPRFGQREVRQGVSSFFLHPGESLEKGIVSAHILGENEALVLQAIINFEETDDKGKKIERISGEHWMIHGPLEYIPPKEVNIVDKRQAIPLSKNEGVYVRDIKSGDIRLVMGPQSYLLTENEQLYKKPLTELVELLLKKGGGHGAESIRKIAYFEQSIDPILIEKGRDPTRVVTYRCPGNTACQVYNYTEKTARVIFGPDLVILGPHENFNVLSLSAGKPKKANALQSLCLMLGPDFITDIIDVETSDHARLRIQMAFNNYFEVDKTDAEASAKLFSVPDFIGFACKHVGSKIRGKVAQVTFDEFHRHSASVIQQAVFDSSTDGKMSNRLHFPSNNLVITNVDIQSIEPVDMKMRDSLMKSVQMAIEIATSSLEAAASHEAARREQEAQGRLERQKLSSEAEAEIAKTELCQLQAEAAAVESTGHAVAEAMGASERMHIECQSEIEIARLKAEAADIEHTAKLDSKAKLQGDEISYLRAQKDLLVDREKQLSQIEVENFRKMVKTLGTDVIKSIATAGPDAELKMLESLGMSSVLFTDGNSPINLFTTAKGLVASK